MLISLSSRMPIDKFLSIICLHGSFLSLCVSVLILPTFLAALTPLTKVRLVRVLAKRIDKAGWGLNTDLDEF